MKFFAVFAAIIATAVAFPATTGWTLHQLSEALQNPHTDPDLVPHLEHALDQLMSAIHAGQAIDSIAVPTPAVSSWTLQQLSDAIANPNTDPAIVPYLEHALNEMMTALHMGQDMETITVLLPVEAEPVMPAPVGPVAPASNPLVQIIIKINNQEQIADIVAPEVVPTPVQVVDNVETNPIDVIAVNPVLVPEPVIVSPVIIPEAVEPNPIDVIAINPVPSPVITQPIIV